VKYRYLTFQELDVLEEDFNNFLYTKGMNNYEWCILQDYYSVEALGLLEQYSDKIFDGMISNVNYLEHRSEKQLKAIECGEDQMTIIGIEVPESSNIDLTDIQSLKMISGNDFKGYRSYKRTESYPIEREQVIFKMIESGCYVVDSSIFNTLNLHRKALHN
jgi:hypothetical protein